LWILWSDPALAEIERVYVRIAEENPDAAERVAQALFDAGNSLDHLPHRGRPVAGTMRRELIAGFDYIIRYRVLGDTVRIERVRHAKRRPTRP
jgi:toxin ParE1/3/4